MCEIKVPIYECVKRAAEWTRGPVKIPEGRERLAALTRNTISLDLDQAVRVDKAHTCMRTIAITI